MASLRTILFIVPCNCHVLLAMYANYHRVREGNFTGHELIFQGTVAELSFITFA